MAEGKCINQYCIGDQYQILFLVLFYLFEPIHAWATWMYFTILMKYISFSFCMAHHVDFMHQNIDRVTAHLYLVIDWNWQNMYCELEMTHIFFIYQIFWWR